MSQDVGHEDDGPAWRQGDIIIEVADRGGRILC
jgi:hypothetical protein